jgi:hypothetical protein
VHPGLDRGIGAFSAVVSHETSMSSQSHGSLRVFSQFASLKWAIVEKVYKF